MSTTDPNIAPLEAQIEPFLRWLFADKGEGRICISQFKTLPDVRNVVERDFKTIEEAAQYATILNQQEPFPHSVYFRSTTVRPDAELNYNSRGKKEHTDALFALMADLDMPAPYKKAANYPADGLAWKRILDHAGMPATTVIHKTGGGMLAIWKLDKPAFASEYGVERLAHLSEYWQKRIESAAKELGKADGLDGGYDFDNTFDLSRVYGVPGTWNQKFRISDPKADPQPRTEIPSEMGPVYTFEELESYVPAYAPGTPKPSASSTTSNPWSAASPTAGQSSLFGGSGRPPKTVAWFERHLAEHVQELTRAKEIGKYNNTLAKVAFWCGHAIGGRFTYEEAFDLMCGVVQQSYGAEPDHSDITTITGQLSKGHADEQWEWASEADAERKAVELAPSNLPDEFWNARPGLQLIRAHAYQRAASADAVFGGVLARIAAAVPPQCGPDSGVASCSSLNMIVALIGPSGTGKTSSQRHASRIMPELAQWNLPSASLGSGEGIAESFMGVKEVPNESDHSKTTKVRAMVRHNSLMEKDEGAELVHMMERQGTTVGDTLRSAWAGSALGQQNGKAESTRIIPDGSYAFAMTIGFQPAVAAKMMTPEQIQLGTAQRFLWISVTDPNIPHEPDLADIPRLELPGGFQAAWDASQAPQGDPSSLFPQNLKLPKMTMEASIRARLFRDQAARNRGEVTIDPLNSHRAFMLVKLSSLLAILDNRMDVTEEDWSLAELMLKTSDVVRGRIQREAQIEAEKEAAKRTKRRQEDGKAAELGRLEAAEACVARHVESFVKKLSEGAPLTRNQLVKATLRTAHRAADGCGDDALGQAVVEGLIQTDGTKYFVTVSS